MALFPTYNQVSYSSPRILTPITRTLISQFDDQGAEQRKRKWLYNKWDIGLTYNNITKAKATILYQFFINRSGRYMSFHWVDEYEDTYVKQYFATGDGTTKIFDLPGKDISDYTIYGDSVPYEEAPDSTSEDYIILSDTGADGGDQAQFYTAPDTGKRLTCDFTGKLKIRCRFQEDIMSFELFYRFVSSGGINLRGLHLDQT